MSAQVTSAASNALNPLAPRLASSRVFDPSALSNDERMALAAALYAVQTQIFDFLARNPGYYEGHGPLTLVPGSWWQAIHGVGSYTLARVRRALRGLFGGARARRRAAVCYALGSPFPAWPADARS